MITDETAGVRYVATPPAAGGRRLVLVWHLIGEPGTPEAMATTLPLAELDAWRVYPTLPPLRGTRLVDGYAPMIEAAVAAIPALVTAARERLGCDHGPIDLVGASAGGHTALVAATRRVVPVRRVAVVNPAVTVHSVVDASLHAGALTDYTWTPTALTAAQPLDVLTTATTLDMPLLIVRGEHEYPAFRPPQDALHTAAPNAHLVEIPGMPHMLVTSQDRVDTEVTTWLA